MTDISVDDLKLSTEYFNELSKNRTPGNWVAIAGMVETDCEDDHEYHPDPCTCYIDLYNQGERTDKSRGKIYANAAFIASAPDMVNHINDLQAEIDKLKQALTL